MIKRNLFKALVTFIVICSLSLSFTSVYAQTGSVSGVVKGANDAFLVGATVSVQGKKNAVTTDEQGKYSLSLPAGKYTIIISYTGYEEHTAIVTIKAGDASMYNATLVLTANNLTEITLGQG